MKNTRTTENHLTSAQRNEIIKLFHGRCLLDPSHSGTDVHEIIPRASAPYSWNRFENQVLLCHYCHIQVVHADGAGVWADRLISLRDKWIKTYGNSERASTEPSGQY